MGCLDMRSEELFKSLPVLTTMCVGTFAITFSLIGVFAFLIFLLPLANLIAANVLAINEKKAKEEVIEIEAESKSSDLHELENSVEKTHENESNLTSQIPFSPSGSKKVEKKGKAR
ncbi:MAG: hypothetical protein LBJ09_01040 [Clostridiales bacterium]|jgi:hypothetical protein|nr:hypothetical protein [Clostridiales bacterium]